MRRELVMTPMIIDPDEFLDGRVLDASADGLSANDRAKALIYGRIRRSHIVAGREQSENIEWQTARQSMLDRIQKDNHDLAWLQEAMDLLNIGVKELPDGRTEAISVDEKESGFPAMGRKQRATTSFWQATAALKRLEGFDFGRDPIGRYIDDLLREERDEVSGLLDDKKSGFPYKAIESFQETMHSVLIIEYNVRSPKESEKVLERLDTLYDTILRYLYLAEQTPLVKNISDLKATFLVELNQISSITNYRAIIDIEGKLGQVKRDIDSELSRLAVNQVVAEILMNHLDQICCQWINPLALDIELGTWSGSIADPNGGKLHISIGPSQNIVLELENITDKSGAYMQRLDKQGPQHEEGIDAHQLVKSLAENGLECRILDSC